MNSSEKDLVPFKLASCALFQARETDADGSFTKWRTLLKRFDQLRSRIDPLADQNANLDVLLRSFENHLAAHLEGGGNLADDTAGYQLHIHLSRLWVLGAYESLRTLHSCLNKHANLNAACLKLTDSKGCGEADCVVCSIGHLKNEAAIARMVIAKGEKASNIKNPPLTEIMKRALLDAPEEIAPIQGKFLVFGESLTSSGCLGWFQHDDRISRDRFINRRELSDMILSWDVSE